MYIRLIRNEANGNAITGRLVIDGRWFCNTLERKGVEIPALCYHVAVTMSPKFKRLLPLVCGVPRTEAKRREARGERQKSKVNETSAAVSPDFKHSTLDIKQSAMRSGIRFHRGTKPEHSTGCILVLGDNWRSVESCSMGQNGVEWSSIEKNNTTQHYTTLPNTTPPQGRTSADVEQELTRLILKAQKEHEEIILEIIDFRPGTEYGYNTPCPPELQKR